MRRIAFSLTVVLIIATAALVFLFRSSSYDRPPFGRFRIYHRWGKPTYMKADINRDGKYDYIDLLPGRFTNHTVPIESWIDLDFDGSFDLHLVWDTSGKVAKLEIMNGAAGGTPEILFGDSAQKRWESIKEPYLATVESLRAQQGQ